MPSGSCGVPTSTPGACQRIPFFRSGIGPPSAKTVTVLGWPAIFPNAFASAPPRPEAAARTLFESASAAPELHKSRRRLSIPSEFIPLSCTATPYRYTCRESVALAMKFLAFLLLALIAVLARATDYPLGPDSQTQPNVPHGTVTKHVLQPGRFYPGTPHNYAVYVPAQYKAAQPTPFMIFLDGSGFLSDKERAPTVFDNLIAKHELPPMIAIFIDPGVLPALSENAQNRYERVFEYDSISDRFSRFLLEELIPAVAKNYDLSANPDDRGLCGVSTGAVGAFMAAWHRPDQFHRVLSFIGTYVAMKGADTLPALVRKTEPKPIRIFMQDGKNDHIVPAEPYGTFYAGSWPINNQVMYEALEYAGYDAKLVMGDEGHNMKQGAAILPDALRWLWRGYPQGIIVHEPPGMHQPGWDPRAKVYSLVDLNEPWQQVDIGNRSAASPAADTNGHVFFSRHR